jgi:outer membrane protein assembly factor BamB
MIAALVISFTGILAAQRPSGDWTQWRGVNRDAAAASFTEPKAWPESLSLKWKIDVGLGYATPLLVGNRIYLFSRQGEDEVMSGIDAATGKVLWRTAYPAPFKMNSAAAVHGAGPKSTPVFVNGRIYSIGMTGVVTSFDSDGGKQLWQKPGSEIVPMFTTHSFSPLFDRGLVVFHLGGHNKGALTAFDAQTGNVRWTWDGDGPGYGSPIVADLGGTRQLVTITQQKIVGVDMATGALLWERPYPVPSTTNSITPILYGQTVIVSGTEQPIVALTISRRDNKWVAENAWENPDVPMRMSNGVIIRDTLVSLTTRNQGQYFSVDAKTGKTLWRSEGRQATNAALVRGGDYVFALQDNGELLVLRGGASAFEPLRRYKVADTATWTPPVVSGNRIFVKDVSTLALYTLE